MEKVEAHLRVVMAPLYQPVKKTQLMGYVKAIYEIGQLEDIE